MSKKGKIIALSSLIASVVVGLVIGIFLPETTMPRITNIILLVTLGYFIPSLVIGIILCFTNKDTGTNMWRQTVSITLKGLGKVTSIVFKLIGKVRKAFDVFWIIGIPFVCMIAAVIIIFTLPIWGFILATGLISFTAISLAAPFFIFCQDLSDRDIMKKITIVGFVIFFIFVILLSVGMFSSSKFNDQTFNITYVMGEGEEHQTGQGYNYKTTYAYDQGLSEYGVQGAKKNGYNFVGWYYDSEFKEPFRPFGAYEKKGDITLYPKFTMNTTTINIRPVFLGEVGSRADLGMTETELTIKGDEELTLPTPTYDSSRYIFVGWSKRGFIKFGSDPNLITTVDASTSTAYPLFLKKADESLAFDNIYKESSYNEVKKVVQINTTSETKYTLGVNIKEGRARFNIALYSASGRAIQEPFECWGFGDYPGVKLNLPANSTVYAIIKTEDKLSYKFHVGDMDPQQLADEIRAAERI